MLDVESQPVALLVPAFVESYAPEGEQAQEYKQHGLGAQYQIGECRRLCLPQAVYAQCEYYTALTYRFTSLPYPVAAVLPQPSPAAAHALFPSPSSHADICAVHRAVRR